MTYGMLASNSCLLTDIVDQLHEEAKKVNSVERLTRHLNKGISGKALNFCYYRLAKGIRGILAFAREGTRFWFRAKRPAYRQLCLRLLI